MADEPDYENVQPAPISNDGPSLHDLVIEDLRSIGEQQVLRDIARRRAYGLEKYKTLLQLHNGRDFGKDLLDEILDGLVYGRGWCEEDPGSGARANIYRRLVDLSIDMRRIMDGHVR